MNSEYVTIIAGTAAQAMEQFRIRQLGAQGFTLLGAMGWHEVIAVRADGSIQRMPTAKDMIAATFVRRSSMPPTPLMPLSEV